MCEDMKCYTTAKTEFGIVGYHTYHHHQLFNAPTAGYRPSLWITHKENGA
jgi:hypothetical protein